MNIALALILSGSIILWKAEPMPLSHVAVWKEFADKKPVMTAQQKHEWTVERQKKNRKERRRK